ncbi:MAG: 1-acyl-sn-glycerol-3-phosphate acyltransferase [Clostridia bacterium]|nr:1-acyl-sn-glycerol-3-phosphate acyltransferase [Clostridia bacterium]
MFHICQIIATPFVRFFFPTKFIGKKHIPTGACIIASNHTSNLDAPLLAVHTWEKKYYLAKKEMVKNKFIGGIVKSWGAIPIDRNGNDVVAIKECLKKLKAGKKLVIFPEGTRQHNENMELGQVKQGTAMLAIKGKVPIVPMFIVNKPKFWHRNTVIIGEPFELSDFYGKRLGSDEMANASKIVEEKLNELREYAINSLTKKK